MSKAALWGFLAGVVVTAAGAIAVTGDRSQPVPIAAQSPAPEIPDLLPALATELPANEASAVVASRRHPGVYYWLRDGGSVKPGQPRTALWGLRLDRTGEPRSLRGDEAFPAYKVVGAGNRDWEALAIDDADNMWIGELGANDCRSRQRLLRVAEPDPTTATSVKVAAEYALRFPDNPRPGCRTYNSEAMFWLDGHLYVVAKTEGSPVYRVDLQEEDKQASLVRIGRFGSGVDNISASSVSDDRTRLMVLDHERLWVYEAGDPSLRGDAYVSDLIAGVPRWQGRFDGPGTASVEGGTFARDSYDLAFVGEDRRIYYTDPAGYGSAPPCPAPPTPPAETETPQPIVSST